MSEWHPIDTLHVDSANRELFFWIVPKTPEETYVDSAGKPIVATHAPYLHRGKYHTWGALSKATHWMLPPDPPESA